MEVTTVEASGRPTVSCRRCSRRWRSATGCNAVLHTRPHHVDYRPAARQPDPSDEEIAKAFPETSAAAPVVKASAMPCEQVKW